MLKSFMTWLTGHTPVDTWVLLIILLGFAVGLGALAKKAIEYMDGRLKGQKDGD